jgi:hypothetical protein
VCVGDAGNTVLKKVESVNTAMDECAKILNIKPHKTKSGVMVSAPVDIEVHQGHDNTYYVIDNQNSVVVVVKNGVLISFVLYCRCWILHESFHPSTLQDTTQPL